MMKHETTWQRTDIMRELSELARPTCNRTSARQLVAGATAMFAAFFLLPDFLSFFLLCCARLAARPVNGAVLVLASSWGRFEVWRSVSCALPLPLTGAGLA